MQVHAYINARRESMICGAIAGATSGALTTPLDVMKTRLMTRQGGASGTLGGVFIDILSREGVGGFAAGLRERAVYIAMGSAIFWTMFEQVMSLISQPVPHIRQSHLLTPTTSTRRRPT